MRIISKEIAELIQQADVGCIKSQLTVGVYYIGGNDLPKDPFMSAHYLSKFLDVPYHIVEEKKHTPIDIYFQVIILCGHQYVQLKDYKTALKYYDKAKEFADEYFTPDQSEPLMLRHDFYEAKELIKDFIHEELDEIDSQLNLHG